MQWEKRPFVSVRVGRRTGTAIKLKFVILYYQDLHKANIIRIEWIEDCRFDRVRKST